MKKISIRAGKIACHLILCYLLYSYDRILKFHCRKARIEFTYLGIQDCVRIFKMYSVVHCLSPSWQLLSLCFYLTSSLQMSVLRLIQVIRSVEKIEKILNSQSCKDTPSLEASRWVFSLSTSHLGWNFFEWDFWKTRKEYLCLVYCF